MTFLSATVIVGLVTLSWNLDTLSGILKSAVSLSGESTLKSSSSMSLCADESCSARTVTLRWFLKGIESISD